jgi:hypothetical protein
MTDRFCGLTVVLDQNIREDDAKPIIEAIKMLRGVLDVTGIVADSAVWVADRRVRWEIEQRLYKVVRGEEP